MTAMLLALFVLAVALMVPQLPAVALGEAPASAPVRAVQSKRQEDVAADELVAWILESGGKVGAALLHSGSGPGFICVT